jgi:hypothetical protein
MESVASLAWNQWQVSYGIGGNFRAEYAASARRAAELIAAARIFAMRAAV